MKKENVKDLFCIGKYYDRLDVVGPIVLKDGFMKFDANLDGVINSVTAPSPDFFICSPSNSDDVVQKKTEKSTYGERVVFDADDVRDVGGYYHIGYTHLGLRQVLHLPKSRCGIIESGHDGIKVEYDTKEYKGKSSNLSCASGCIFLTSRHFKKRLSTRYFDCTFEVPYCCCAKEDLMSDGNKILRSRKCILKDSVEKMEERW